ncbi:MAG TPA: hydrogenase maturation nickel metallochaperone HypA [Thermoguttaceae bacterium]
MHELSIVEALIEQVQREVHRVGHRGRILRIELNIGRLSGVNCDSVRFAFDLLAPGTPVEGAELAILVPRAACQCQACNARIEIDDLVFQCPKCSSDAITIEGGRDLLLQSIEVEDEQPVKFEE